MREEHRRDSATPKAYDRRYNAWGQLVRIERSGQTIWTATAKDASNRVTGSNLGNGLSVEQTYDPYTGRQASGDVVGPGSNLLESYQYDVLGNVMQRNQQWGDTSFTENFTYDQLNRLKTAQIVGYAQQLFEYDDIGNLRKKSGVGSGDYVYLDSGANSVRPHAVSSIPGIGSFYYDDNGNMLSGAGRTITWTSFDMPLTISKVGGPSSTFFYGSDHQRVKQLREGGAGATTVWYAGSMEVETVGSAVTVKTYLPNGLGVEIDKAGTTQLYYVHRDRLGSVVALSDQAGSLVESMAYDSWGKRRQEVAPNTPDGIGVLDNKGFTGHEMLDQLDLVHMNGRVYDPFVARFMSADPLIQEPEHSQSYNRYTYVWNNPTNLTDPTGFVALATSSFTDKDGNCDKRCQQLEGDLARERARGTPTGPPERGTSGGGANRSADCSGGNCNSTSANNTARAQPEKNYGDHWAEYKKEVPFSGGDGPSTNAMGYDDWALGKGYMTQETWNERRGALAAGAGIGLGIAATGAVATEAYAAGGLVAGIKNILGIGKSLSKEAEKSIKSYERLIREHEKKLDDFRTNPTVRPGMENLPRDVIEKAQGRRIRHLEAEIQKFKDNIDKLRNGG